MRDAGIDPETLRQIVWRTLSGEHARYSVGTDNARRYAPGFSPIIAFADPTKPVFDDLRAYCTAGEHFYCDGLTGAPPQPWQIDQEARFHKMVWEGPAPDNDAAPDAQALRAGHIDQALALATLTNPGPFGPRTIELGDYYGIFEGERLIAMAGERFHDGNMREISGVCTLPEYQGQGLARRLMQKLIRIQIQRGQIPFLHVMHDNSTARALYERLGFSSRLETIVRVLSLTHS
jgi:ribosomal protein S18 acetylase RimI-like enzyme